MTDALTVLSAMITPAVLLSACGTLILSTSNRLGRVVDRVRALSQEMEELGQAELEEDRRLFVIQQLRQLMRRSRLLQRALTVLYVSVCLFVSTSVTIGVVSFAKVEASSIPVAIGILGACLLFYASILLIIEARFAFGTLRIELDYLWRRGKLHASEEVREEISQG